MSQGGPASKYVDLECLLENGTEFRNRQLEKPKMITVFGKDSIVTVNATNVLDPTRLFWPQPRFELIVCWQRKNCIRFHLHQLGPCFARNYLDRSLKEYLDEL